MLSFVFFFGSSSLQLHCLAKAMWVAARWSCFGVVAEVWKLHKEEGWSSELRPLVVSRKVCVGECRLQSIYAGSYWVILGILSHSWCYVKFTYCRLLKVGSLQYGWSFCVNGRACCFVQSPLLHGQRAGGFTQRFTHFLCTQVCPVQKGMANFLFFLFCLKIVT